MIDRNDIAEIYEAVGDERAGLARSLADEEAREVHEEDALSGEILDRIWKWLNGTDDPGHRGHGETCWKRYASCLADKIRQEISPD